VLYCYYSNGQRLKMKFWLIGLLLQSSIVLAQTEIKFNDSIFGDSISYQSANGSRQQIHIHKHNISKDSKSTIILLHGCGGLKEHSKIWIKQLTEWNYNIIVVDSYTSRGMPNGACTSSAYLRNPPDDRVEDLFATASWVITQSWNKGKPATIGFSHGGNTVYLASNSPKSRELLSSGVSFYPYCWYYVVPNAGWPLQIHVGTADDWNSAATCIRNEKRQRATLEFFMYDGVHHGWDIEGANYTMPATDGRNISNKTVKFDYEANRLSRERTKKWFDTHFNLDM